ncbi:hypothetical protein TURU_086536 [Turdus rufiventris]|nr:hypothetical protein TURU_086536 [Turdus rufiventris]
MAGGSRPGGALLLLLLLLMMMMMMPLPAAGGGCAAEGGPLEPFDALYASGVEAYYGGDFAGAARCLERALRSRRELRAARLRCRRLCRAQVRLEEPGPGAGGDLSFFGSVLRRADCVRRCEEPRLGAVSRHRVAEEVRADFQRRVPYSYLQRAYIQRKTPRNPSVTPQHPVPEVFPFQTSRTDSMFQELALPVKLEDGVVDVLVICMAIWVLGIEAKGRHSFD